MPRHSIRQTGVVLLPTTVDVQVVEISVIGLLMLANEPYEIESHGCLRMTLSGVPFNVEVQVRRVTSTGSGYEIAASFVAIGPEQREVIERFVGQ